MYIDVRGQQNLCSHRRQGIRQQPANVMFVHGSGLDHRSWALQTRWFAYNGYSVLAPDLPGHSLSAGEALKASRTWAPGWPNSFALAGSARYTQSAFTGFSRCTRTRAPGIRIVEIDYRGWHRRCDSGQPRIDRGCQKQRRRDAADMLLMWGFGPDAQYGISAVPGMQPIAIGRQIMARNPLHADLVACSEYINGSEVAKTIDLYQRN